MNSRNYTVDFIRTLGALSVIVLHMRYIGISDYTVNIMSLFARWAVPFFFLLSGFFFEKKSRLNLNDEFLKTFKNLIGIFVVSNLIYFFIAAKTEYYTLSDILSLKSILLGDYIHLWFIGSMIFSYIVLWFILSNGWDNLMLPLAIFTLFFTLVADPYSVFFDLHIEGPFSRFLLSIPFLFIGFLCSKNFSSRLFNTLTGLLLSLSGFLLQFAEGYIIFHRSKQNLFRHEFLLGTFVLSVGIFILSQSVKINKDTFISRIGRNYSLLVYLYHPLIIVIIFYIIKKLNLQSSNYLLWFNPITVFAITLSLVKLIEKRFPYLLKLITGKA
jgi:surface polysaccharide O-acyltransferase-like enzyme